jgi:hypothetical protein
MLTLKRLGIWGTYRGQGWLALSWRRFFSALLIVGGGGFIGQDYFAPIAMAIPPEDSETSNYCDGKYKDGALNGLYTCIFPSGNRYQGEFKNSQRQGKGTWTYVDGTRCEGEFRNNFLVKGMCRFPSGSRYEGEWQNNRRQGLGVMTYADGTRCEGRFRDDQLNGAGQE